MEKKTKILFSTGVFPPILGGPGKVIKRLALELKKFGFEPTVLTFGDKKKKNMITGLKEFLFQSPSL